jgi:glycosyltransferase involved in cell wall biosynthesis
LKLGLDAKRAFNNHSGLGVYARCLIGYLEKNIQHKDIILFTPKKKNWTANLLTIKSKLGSFWRSFSIYFDLVKNKIDVYHGLAGELPFFIPRQVKTVVTIHDLLFLRFPSDYPWLDRVFYKIKSKYACQRADRIIAISEVTKNDIISYYKIPSEKIAVISPSIPELPEVSDERPLTNDYIVCISSFIGRKNQEILIHAFEKIAHQVSFDLVFIGSGNLLKHAKSLAKQSSYSNRIHFLTGLNDNEKFCYLKHCLFSVYPSLGEGFGIPIIESFSLNKPIILSDTMIHREVAGDAGVYFKLGSIDDLANKIMNLYSKQLSPTNEIMQNRLQNFKDEMIYPKLMEIYFSLIGRDPRI